MTVPVERKVQQRSTQKRVENGTIIPLGSEVGTYIVPVTLGTTTYPLQLDFASSDLLLASTACGSDCPKSLGGTTNPYLDVSAHSATFQTVNENSTAFEVSFADTTHASGFAAREKVVIDQAEIVGQVFGMPASVVRSASANIQVWSTPPT